jgi:hypothetical protein
MHVISPSAIMISPIARWSPRKMQKSSSGKPSELLTADRLLPIDFGLQLQLSTGCPGAKQRSK